MPYCTAADIQAKAQNTTFSDGPSPPLTKPSLTQIGDFIVQITADMDQKMRGGGVVVPVLASKADYLRLICTYGVLGEVYGSMDVEIETKNRRRWRELYEESMQAILDNPQAMNVDDTLYSPPVDASEQRDEPFIEEGVRKW